MALFRMAPANRMLPRVTVFLMPFGIAAPFSLGDGLGQRR
jgi:hypothetical protein